MKGLWEPLIYSLSVRSSGNNLDLQLAFWIRGVIETSNLYPVGHKSKEPGLPAFVQNVWEGRGWGKSSWTEPITCGIWCYLQVDSAGNEVTSGTPCWCLRIVRWCRRNPTSAYWNYIWELDLSPTPILLSVFCIWLFLDSTHKWYCYICMYITSFHQVDGHLVASIFCLLLVMLQQIWECI